MDIPSKFGIPEHEFRVVFGRTKIEFDLNKEEGNREKHGYSLESAVYLLNGLLSLTGNSKPYLVSDGFLENGETRHMHMSADDSGNVVLMVTTMRPNEAVRIISFRRANENECMIFQQHTGYRNT